MELETHSGKSDNPIESWDFIELQNNVWSPKEHIYINKSIYDNIVQESNIKHSSSSRVQ